MTEREGAKPEITEGDPPFPPHDTTLSAADRYALQEALPSIFDTAPAISSLLMRIGYPQAMVPAMTDKMPREIWAQIFRDLDNGVIADPYQQLLRAAIRSYSANETLRSIALRHGLIETYHVIFSVTTEEDREQARELLGRLGLGPREVWSTPHAVSYRLGSERTDDPRFLLESSDTNLGWIVVPPGRPDYVYRLLSMEGPDGRQFRLTDTPAQETVGAVADEVVDQYSGELISSTRPTTVDRIGPGGQAERLDPEQTLHDAGVQDGDRLRVSSQAYAGGGSVFVGADRSSVDEPQLMLHELMVEQQRVKLEREQVALERERIRLRQEDLKLKQEELILQEVSRRVAKSGHPAHSSHADMTLAEDIPSADSMQLAIYADVEEDTKEWRRLAHAGEAVAEALGYERESQLPTQHGSVFQRAFWKRVATSEEARQYEAMLQQAFGLKVAMLNQAEVDSKQATAAAALIAAVAAVPTACVKVGSLLLIKYIAAANDDPVVLVRSLSSREVQAIDRYPAILKNPHTVLDALNMAIAAAEPPETTPSELGPE